MIDWTAVSSITSMLMVIATFGIIFYTWWENRREREYKKTREKLLFYSKLKSHEAGYKEPAKSLFEYLQNDEEIQNEYPVFAERKLKELLKKVFPSIRSQAEGSFNKVVNEMNEIVEQIELDFKKLNEKYDLF